MIFWWRLVGAQRYLEESECERESRALAKFDGRCVHLVSWWESPDMLVVKGISYCIIGVYYIMWYEVRTWACCDVASRENSGDERGIWFDVAVRKQHSFTTVEISKLRTLSHILAHLLFKWGIIAREMQQRRLQQWPPRQFKWSMWNCWWQYCDSFWERILLHRDSDPHGDRPSCSTFLRSALL